MDMKIPKNSAVLFLFLFLFLVSPCYADEVFLQDHEHALSGTVLKEDEGSVTIRIPKEAVRSIVRDQKERSNTHPFVQEAPLPATETGLSEKVLELQKRIERLESSMEAPEKTEALPRSSITGRETITEQIIEEEMGRVEGVIQWQGKPLDQRDVKIVLTNYTGFSFSSLKKAFQRDPSTSSDQQELTFVTKTDSQGRYIFEKVPPGQYRLYWLPDKETAWIRRMQDKPDLEVVAGKLTIQNIPGKIK